jgi:hypothetical protein
MLAATIKELLLNEAKAVELGLNGKQRALELFDERIYLERLLQMYEHVLRTKLPHNYSAWSAEQYAA